MTSFSYASDAEIRNNKEAKIVFDHDPNLSFTLVIPPNPPNTFARKKTKAFLFVNGLGEEETFPDKPYWTGPKMLARSLKKNIEAYNGALSQERLDEIIDISTKNALKKRLLALFSRRDYSEKEILEKLLDEGYPLKEIRHLIEKAREGNLIDDKRFADIYIRSKLGLGWGSQKIEQELLKKGISLGDIEGWPEEYLDKKGDVERAFSLIQNRPALCKAKNVYEKSMRFLVNKGYGFDIAKEATNRFLDTLKD